MTPPTAILVANRGFAIARSRGRLIAHLVAKGWRVVVAAGVDQTFPELAALGAIPVPLPVARGGFAPWTDLRTYLVLRRLYAQERPALIHHFHAKPIILGGAAAGAVAPQAVVVDTVTGLGHGFDRPGLRGTLARRGYRVAGRAAAVIFQNPDDRAVFLAHGWVTPERAHLIISSGADLTRFHPGTATVTPPRVAMVARLLWDKGIREFVDAARQVRAARPDVECVIGGEWDPAHPNAVDRPWMEAQVAAGTIRFLGYVTDMPRFLRETTLFVLPSYYGEGVPRVLIEAAATGVPVVTCDEAGCREAVRPGVTGALVPGRDATALAAAILDLLGDPARLSAMQRASRALAEAEFDLERITERQLDVYRRAGVPLA